jgi:hypothetical protein
MSDIVPTEIERALSLRTKIEGHFLELGAELYKIQKNESYKGMYSSWREFAEMGMRMSPGNLSKIIQVFERFVLELKVSPVKLQEAGYSNLYTAIPLLKADNVEEIVEKAATLGRRGIELLVVDSKHGEHDCVPDLEVCLRPCSTCGRMMRV